MKLEILEDHEKPDVKGEEVLNKVYSSEINNSTISTIDRVSSTEPLALLSLLCSNPPSRVLAPMDGSQSRTTGVSFLSFPTRKERT